MAHADGMDRKLGISKMLEERYSVVPGLLVKLYASGRAEEARSIIASMPGIIRYIMKDILLRLRIRPTALYNRLLDAGH